MPDRFRIVTWNVENLARPNTSDPGAFAAYEEKIRFLGEVVRTLDPDVLALQEILDRDALIDLQAELSPVFAHAAEGLAGGRPIRVAFLSKLPFVEPEQHIETFPTDPVFRINEATADGSEELLTRMGRPALRIRVETPIGVVDVITAHLKSKLLTYPRPGGGSSFSTRDEGLRTRVAAAALLRRTVEAATLRAAVNELLTDGPDRGLIVLGDLNDVPEAQTSQILTGPAGSQIGTGGFHRPDQEDRDRLFNLASAIAAERRYSRIHQGERELLDQILVSEELLPRGPDGKRRIPLADSHVDAHPMPSVTEDRAARANAVAPDHAPVSATFEL